MGKEFGLGIIGLGPWSSVLAEAIGRSGGLRLRACFGRSRERGRAFAERFGCETAPTFEALVGHPGVRGVVIASPNHLHAPHAIQAARAGRHVFVEKPLAVTVKEAEATLAACRLAGVALAVGHEFRRLGSHRAVRRVLERGSLGTLLAIEVYLDMARGLSLPPEDWRADPECLPAGPLSQFGTHLADTLAYLGGPIAEVAALTSRRASPVLADDVATACLRFASGALGILRTSFVAGPSYGLRVWGTRGAVECAPDMSLWPRAHELDARTTLRLTTPAGTAPMRSGGADPVLEELEDFAAAAAGRPPEVSGAEGLAALRVVWAAIQSARTGRRVGLPAAEGTIGEHS